MVDYRGGNSNAAASRNWRFLSTDSNKVDEPFKVEEAETVNDPPPQSEKVLFFRNSLACFILVFVG